MNYFVGIDIGSVNSKIAVLNGRCAVVFSLTSPTNGKPIAVSRELIAQCEQLIGKEYSLTVTGSARDLVGKELHADIVKNEITCQALAADYYLPEASSVIEIGGQDSKLILLSNGFVENFSMNTVCAAGTGSFLEHQATRLGMPIEKFADIGSNSANPEKINARCTVFAESDMIHAQQSGACPSDIIFGLCLALARNFLSDTGKIGGIKPPVVFQGGVARNQAMVKAFTEVLGIEPFIPNQPELSGAMGAALIQIRNIKHNVSTVSSCIS